MASEFHYLEHVALADAAFEAHGDSPSELFVAAAQAVIEVMVDPQAVEPRKEQVIDRQNPVLADLLFDWLSDIVYWKDVEGLVFRAATATVSQDRSGEWRLHGKLIGEPIDQARHQLRSDVKAVTKHLYEVKQDDRGRWHARVVLDI